MNRQASFWTVATLLALLICTAPLIRLAHAAPATTRPSADESAQTSGDSIVPPSLLNRKVKVYFKTGEAPVPETHFVSIEAKVIAVHAGWLELSNFDSDVPNVWIPVSHISVIIDLEVVGR